MSDYRGLFEYSLPIGTIKIGLDYTECWIIEVLDYWGSMHCMISLFYKWM